MNIYVSQGSATTDFRRDGRCYSVFFSSSSQNGRCNEIIKIDTSLPFCPHCPAVITKRMHGCIFDSQCVHCVSIFGCDVRTGLKRIAIMAPTGSVLAMIYDIKTLEWQWKRSCSSCGEWNASSHFIATCRAPMRTVVGWNFRLFDDLNALAAVVRHSPAVGQQSLQVLCTQSHATHLQHATFHGIQSQMQIIGRQQTAPNVKAC